MTEDASLDQFASSDAPETDDDESVDSESVEPESTDSETPEDSAKQSEEEASVEQFEAAAAVEPAVSTFTWSPEGECADCGALVERRWRGEGQQDGGLVCADCKEW